MCELVDCWLHIGNRQIWNSTGSLKNVTIKTQEVGSNLKYSICSDLFLGTPIPSVCFGVKNSGWEDVLFLKTNEPALWITNVPHFLKNLLFPLIVLQCIQVLMTTTRIFKSYLSCPECSWCCWKYPSCHPHPQNTHNNYCGLCHPWNNPIPGNWNLTWSKRKAW